MMVLATTSSLRSALNPALVFGLMFRIGWPYLVLIALLTLLAGSTRALVAFLAERVEPQTLLVITGLSFMYFTVIMFHLMGYVVYQYHERLGLVPSQAEESEPQDPELEQFRQFMAEAKYAAALEELRNIVPRRWGELELHRLVHKLAKLTGDHEVLLRHGEQYLGVLLEQNRVREAMEIYQDLVAVKPQFRPTLADQHLPIAQMLRDSRLPREAIALINGFHKRFPHSELTPALYLLAAKIFHDDLNDDAKARQILRFVATQHPSHGLIGSIEHYLRILEGGSTPGEAGTASP
jgi:tetratricopeptide (TPR) repeat protein